MHLLQHGYAVIHKALVIVCAISKFYSSLIPDGEVRIRGTHWPRCLHSALWQRSSPVGCATIERFRVCQGKHLATREVPLHLAKHLSFHTAFKRGRNHILSDYIRNETSNLIADTAHLRHWSELTILPCAIVDLDQWDLVLYKHFPERFPVYTKSKDLGPYGSWPLFYQLLHGELY